MDKNIQEYIYLVSCSNALLLQKQKEKNKKSRNTNSILYYLMIISEWKSISIDKHLFIAFCLIRISCMDFVCVSMCLCAKQRELLLFLLFYYQNVNIYISTDHIKTTNGIWKIRWKRKKKNNNNCRMEKQHTKGEEIKWDKWKWRKIRIRNPHKYLSTLF